MSAATKAPHEAALRRWRVRKATFVLRTPVFALGAARRGHNETFVLRTPVFALGAARRAHASLWLAIALVAPLGLWAYHGAALELDIGTLLSLCAPAAGN